MPETTEAIVAELRHVAELPTKPSEKGRQELARLLAAWMDGKPLFFEESFDYGPRHEPKDDIVVLVDLAFADILSSTDPSVVKLRDAYRETIGWESRKDDFYFLSRNDYTTRCLLQSIFSLVFGPVCMDGHFPIVTPNHGQQVLNELAVGVARRWVALGLAEENVPSYPIPMHPSPLEIRFTKGGDYEVNYGDARIDFCEKLHLRWFHEDQMQTSACAHSTLPLPEAVAMLHAASTHLQRQLDNKQKDS